MGIHHRFSASSKGVSPHSLALKKAREAAGYSLEDLAIATGLTQEEIFSVETGFDENEGRRGRMAAVLKVKVE